uniref:Transmembrane protein 168 n=1 Tax=Plectus sambesii TaxID=2011161 RepID=A0A914VZG6_9BILA
MDKVDDMSRSPERQRAVRKLHRLLGLLELLPEVILTCGVALAWYIRYTHYAYTSLMVVGACGMAVALLNVLLCYLNRPVALPSLYHLWLGCLLGLVALLDISSNLQHALGEWEDVANLMLVASVICQAFVLVLMRCCKAQGVLDRLWSRTDLLELIGAAGACLLAAPPDDLWSLLLLLLALGVVLTALRVGSVLSVANLALLLFTCEHYLFPDLHLSVNPYGMIVLISRLTITPLLDLALGSLTRLDRWHGLIIARPFCHRLTLTAMLVLEMSFFVAHAAVVKNHKEWYVVVPLFAVASVVWLVMHIVFAVILATLASRFSASQVSMSGSLSLKKALAARGLRYFESFVALQTLQLSKSRRDPESPPAIGDFTDAWTDFNSSAGGMRSAVFESQKPLYAVSRRWTDYDFRHPTAEEVLEYWTLTLPRVTHGCLKILMCGVSTRAPFCEFCCSRLIRRLRLRCWPPSELDTGHGFRLLLG